MFGTGVLITSVLTLITPQMADINIWALVTVRVIIGFFEVGVLPVIKLASHHSAMCTCRE